MPEPEPETPERKQSPTGRIVIGDAVLNFLADTTNLDKSVNEIIARLERALAAFKAEWNRK